MGSDRSPSGDSCHVHTYANDRKEEVMYLRPVDERPKLRVGHAVVDLFKFIVFLSIGALIGAMMLGAYLFTNYPFGSAVAIFVVVAYLVRRRR